MTVRQIKFDGDANSYEQSSTVGVLSLLTADGEYPEAYGGLTFGHDPQTGASSFDPIGQTAPYDIDTMLAVAGTGKRIRVDRIAGTFTIKLTAYVPDGKYRTTGLRVLQSNGSTVAFAQSVNNRVTDGLGAARLILTDGSMVTVGTSDPGTQITTTGSHFYIDLPANGDYPNCITLIEFDDANSSAGAALAGSISSVSTVEGSLKVAAQLEQ
jgi:hypothetical protein